MPLQSTSSRVEAPAGQTFSVIPEDVYQVVVKDVDEKVMKKYQSDEDETFYVFKLAILGDVPAEILGQTVSIFATRKWFSGSKKASPSKLVNFVKAIYAYYYPKLSVVELEAEDMTPEVINDLIGKQLRITIKVKPRADGNGDTNNVTEFMSIKKELELPNEVKIDAPKEVAKPEGVEVKEAKKGETNEAEGADSEQSGMPF